MIVIVILRYLPSTFACSTISQVINNITKFIHSQTYSTLIELNFIEKSRFMQ